MPASFIEIAIYRCGEADFDSQLEMDVADALKDIEQRGGAPPDKAPQTYRNAEEHFRDAYGGPWRYNQVIGWLRLYAGGSWILADVWLCDGKRFRRRMRDKCFHYIGSEVVAEFTAELSSSEIFDHLCKKLLEFERGWRRRGFVLELECLMEVGRFVNWRALVHKEGQRQRGPVALYGFKSTRLELIP